MIEFEDVELGYKEHRVVSNINIRMSYGLSVAIIGASGSGKTTFLRALAGLASPLFGRITLDGHAVHDLAEKGDLWPTVTLVFQDHRLFANLSALQNCLIGVRTRNDRDSGDEGRQILDSLGVADCMERRPSQLSHGQRARVAVARALIRQPRVLLLDEPTASLDPNARVLLKNTLQKNSDINNCITIVATHDFEFAAKWASLFIVIKSRTIETRTNFADAVGLYAE